MNQGKLDVIKEEVVRLNITILGINELKWIGMVSLTHMTILPNIVGKKP